MKYGFWPEPKCQGKKKIFYFLIVHQLNCELHLILFFQHFQAHRSPLNSPEKIQTSTVLSVSLFITIRLYYRSCAHNNRPFYLLTLLKAHFYSEKGTFFFWVPKPGSNLHAGRDTLAIKKWHKIVDKFKWLLVTTPRTFKTWTISLKSIFCTCGNSTQNFAEIS